MHTNNKKNDDTQDQSQAALSADIHTAIALWKAKDWTTYKTLRDTLLRVIRSGRGDEVGIRQMQFIYFINTHLRHRFAREVSDQTMFLVALPPHRPVDDTAWRIATEGQFWNEAL